MIKLLVELWKIGLLIYIILILFHWSINFNIILIVLVNILLLKLVEKFLG